MTDKLTLSRITCKHHRKNDENDDGNKWGRHLWYTTCHHFHSKGESVHDLQLPKKKKKGMCPSCSNIILPFHGPTATGWSTWFVYKVVRSTQGWSAWKHSSLRCCWQFMDAFRCMSNLVNVSVVFVQTFPFQLLHTKGSLSFHISFFFLFKFWIQVFFKVSKSVTCLKLSAVSSFCCYHRRRHYHLERSPF